MKLSFLVRSDALKVTSALSRISKELGDSLQILAGGSRFINPGSDPGGRALTDRLQLDIRKANAAITNGTSGIAATSMAIDGISEIILVLTRMKEIASTGANSLLRPEQRSALATEFTLLSSEADRIAASTEFNSFKMLSNSRELYIQVGLEGNASQNAILVPQTLATMQSVGLRTAAGMLTVSITGATASIAAWASHFAINPIEDAIQTLIQRRAVLYGTEGRLETAVNQMTNAREVYQASVDNIKSPNYAEELARSTRLQILSNTTTALLAQANLNESRVLQLLQPPSGFFGQNK
jgi:flagellin